MSDVRNGDFNRGPSDIIQTGGPPLGPPDDKAVAIAVTELERRLANLRLEYNQLLKRVERLEGKLCE